MLFSSFFLFSLLSLSLSLSLSFLSSFLIVFDPTETELPEDVLVQDLLFVFQGIDGKYITMKKGSEGYRIPHEVIITINN